MKKITHVFFSVLSCLGCATLQAERPNILLIMSDDMGFSDLGCFGSEIQTPNLDALAYKGLRFTQFYNAARCCPTRASLLTGLYPHQAGLGHMTHDRGLDGYRGQLSRQCVTIAEVLRPAGYRTYICGKWHVCRDIRPDGDKSVWPLQRGFDRFYGTITGGGSYYDPTTLCRQNSFITPENDPEYRPTPFYYTDAISDNAVRFLKHHADTASDKPFFLYVAYTAAHWPMHALERDIAKYRALYDAGFEPIRRARFERLKQLGLIDAKAELSPADEHWNKTDHKHWNARCMEVYAAMIDCMDRGIGRIITQLKRDGRFENTLILFLQDNGACAEEMGRNCNPVEPPKPLNPFGPDDFQPRIWPPMQTRDGRWVRTGHEVMPGPANSYVAYGRGWANVSNTPFREYKHWVHEGGISTPLIVHWPAGIPLRRNGDLERLPSHLIDIMPTCVDASRATYPTRFGDERIKPMEGRSLLPTMQDISSNPKRPLCWEHEGNRAIRYGKWKFVAKEKRRWELYDINRDRSELHNLAAQFPQLSSELSQKWEAWANRAAVLPLGAWRVKIRNAKGSQ